MSLATPPKIQQHWLRIGLIVLILSLALWLRLRLIQTIPLWGDQAFTLNAAMHWVNGGDIPLAANKSSVGIMNPPMIEYVYALALRIWPDMLSAALITLISGMFALGLASWAAYKVFGWEAGLWTLILFAFNPWSVNYSQLIWNQTMIPAFATLTLVMLLLYFAVEQRSFYLVLAFAGLACLTQVHPGSWMQGVSMGLAMLLFWRRLRWRALLAGVATFVLLYVPFLMYENGVGWMDVPAVLEMVRQPSTFSWASVLVSLDLLHGAGLLETAVFTKPFDTFMTLLFGLSLIYIVGWGIKSVKQRQQPAINRKLTAIVILMIWFLMPLLVYLRSSVYLQIYYLMGQWPAHFIIMGGAIGGVQQWLARPQRRSWGRWLNAGLVAVLLLVVVGQIMVSVTVQNNRRDDELAGDTIQLGFLRDVIDEAELMMAERADCSLVILTKGHQLENSKLALMREFTNVADVVLADGNLALPLPSSCAVYLDTLPGSRASKWLAETAVSLPVSEIQQKSGWRFYDLPEATRAQLLTDLSAQSDQNTWENGVTLRQFSRTAVQSGTPLTLTLVWDVLQEPPVVAYHIGTYLLTPENEVVAQADGPGFDSIQWQPGESFITWFDIQVPADVPDGPYRLALAYYTWPTLERINLLSGENTYFAEEIEIPEP